MQVQLLKRLDDVNKQIIKTWKSKKAFTDYYKVDNFDAAGDLAIIENNAVVHVGQTYFYEYKKYNIIFSSLTFENDYNKISVIACGPGDAIGKAMQKIKKQVITAGYKTTLENDYIAMIDTDGDIINDFFNFRIE